MEALKTVTISKRAELAAKGDIPGFTGLKLRGRTRGLNQVRLSGYCLERESS